MHMFIYVCVCVCVWGGGGGGVSPMKGGFKKQQIKPSFQTFGFHGVILKAN